MDRIKGLKKHFRASNLLVAGMVILMAVQALYYFGATRSMRALSLSCALTLIVIGVYVLYRVLRRLGIGEERTRLSVFVVMLVFMGLGYMYVFVPSTVPDEIYHFWAAYQLSNDILFVEGNGETLYMRGSDADFFLACLYKTELTPERLVEIMTYFEVGSSNPSIVDSGVILPTDLASNPVQDRLLPALGISLGRLLGFGSVITYYLGRLFNLAGFIVMAAFSVKIAPIGKKCFMVVAMLPITMHLAASYSYDAFIIGMAMLLTALCLHAIRSHSQVDLKMMIGIGVIVVLLAPCKVIYTLIIVLIYFIPNSRFASKKQAIWFKVLIPVVAIIAISFSKLPTVMSMVGLEAATGADAELDVRGDETGNYWTLTGWLSRPATAFMMFIRTLVEKGDFYFLSGVGGSLGWLQANIISPGYLIFPIVFLLFASCIRSQDDDALLSNKRRAIVICVVALGWLAVMMSMLTGWTFDTEYIIEGVQGRYLLPFLPLLLLALRPKKLFCEMRLDFWIPYGMLVITAINLARIMSRIYM